MRATELFYRRARNSSILIVFGQWRCRGSGQALGTHRPLARLRRAPGLSWRCFMVATLPEFDSRSGPVRSALAENRFAWIALLEHQARVAQAAGDLPAAPPAKLVALEIDAVLSTASVDRNLTDDEAVLADARALLAHRIANAPATVRRPAEEAKPRKRPPRQS
jgi:hypothetical protein